MARSYANVATAIWRDDEFRVLSIAAQHAYLLLVSQPDISAAGVLSLNLTRWAARTKDVTRSSLRAALEELQAHHFVVVDDDTEELLVRSFVRWDNGYSNPKRRPVIRDASAEIESRALRDALATEFRRLDLPADWVPDSHPDRPSDSHPDSLSAVEQPPDYVPETPQVDSLSDSHPDTVSASERVVVTKARGVDTPTHNPQSTTRVPVANGDPREHARKRATRIPDDFAITPDMAAWGREHAPHVNGAYETTKFVDYWRAKSGKDATKTDWPATWRNWMRKAQEDGRTRRGPTTGANRHTAQRHDNPFAEVAP